MPIIQINWPKIKDRLGDVTALYALTHRQAGLLLSLTEQLGWEKTFRSPDYDWEDKDSLDLEIGDTRNNLTMPVNLTDIIGYIDDIEDLLIALQSTANCCDGNSDITDGDFYTDEVIDGVGDVPQNIIDAGFATDAADWSGFDDYKCMISHVIVDSMEAKLRKLAPFVDSAGVIVGGIATIASILSVIFTGGLSALALGIIAATGSTALLYKLITDGSILVGIADDVADDHDELACAIYEADGSAGSLAALDDKIDELYSEPVTTLLQNLNLGPELKSLYGGRHNEQDIAAALEANGYDPASFDCSCEIPIPEGEYCPNYHWRADASQWVLAGDWAYQDLEGSYDGFDIDGILRPVTDQFPTNHWDCKSEPFDWPGGRVDVVVRVKCANSGDPVRRRTSAVVRFVRASDDAILDSYGWTLEGDSNEWVEGSDTSDTTVHPEGEYYITLAIDGYDGYGGRDCDRISIRVHGT